MDLGARASLHGFVPFAAGSPWNQDITSATVDSNSTNIINFIGGAVGLHADFGTEPTYGIPYIVVDSSQARVPITFTDYGDESDPATMPIPANAPIEGGTSSSGDRHVLVLDKGSCWLYELGNAYPQSGGAWDASGGYVWDLLGNPQQRPWTWTSADAAGLPIFPGLVRYDEVAAGEIRHALRFTLQRSRAAFVPPASHWAANNSNQYAAPMGMRLRLKASVNISGYSAANQVILRAMKKYGLIMADNGSSMFISGVSDSRWNDDDLHELANIKASDFEVLTMNPIYTESNVPSGTPPQIGSFSASSMTIHAGQSTTLSWTISNATYVIIGPDIGPVRGSSVSVSPTTTTTYTLYATNQYERSTATVRITVQ